MNDIRCKTCHFWGTPGEAGEVVRTCQKIVHHAKHTSGDLAYAATWHDDYATFVTREDFGCVLYQDSQKEAS